jgi:hypothetical protein
MLKKISILQPKDLLEEKKLLSKGNAKKTFHCVHFKSLPNSFLLVLARVARFLLAQFTNTGKIYQIATKYTRLPQNIPDYHKKSQITTKNPRLPQKIPDNQKSTRLPKIYQITKKTRLPQNVSDYHNIYQMPIKYIKWP